MTACIDCAAEGVTTKRPIVSGVRKPRCASHERARRKKAKAQSHGRMVERVYSLSAEQYNLLYQAQGGRCGLCQVATGKAKRLAVDHNHECPEDHPRERGCPKCIRGLLCSPCNVALGRFRVEVLIRALNYLYDPPAQRALQGVPSHNQ